MGTYLLTGLQAVQARYPVIVDVRGRGLMVGVELEATEAAHGTNLAAKLFGAGFIVNYQPQNAAFRLFPPYVITHEEIDAFLAAFNDVMAGMPGSESTTLHD